MMVVWWWVYQNKSEAIVTVHFPPAAMEAAQLSTWMTNTSITLYVIYHSHSNQHVPMMFALVVGAVTCHWMVK